MTKFASAVLILVFALSGCTPLQPTTAPEEHALAKAEATVWDGLSSLPYRDQQVLLNLGVNALDIRLTAIDSATSSIDLQTFLWKFDQAGGAIADQLLAAAERGVRVRVLVDDTFLLGEDAVVRAFADHPRIEYRIYNPHKQRAGGLVSGQLENLVDLKRLDHRMHNKSMMVDGQIAIVGGRNLADEYFGLHGDANFRDLELLVRGPVVNELSTAFDEYWNTPWSFPIDDIVGSKKKERTSAPLPEGLHEPASPSELSQRWHDLFIQAAAGDVELIVDKAPTADPSLESEAPVQVAERLTEVFNAAEQEVIILSAYLIPTERLENAVREANERGVRIRILTNSLASNNHLTAHSAYRTHISALLGHGVELSEVRVDAADRPLYMILPSDEMQLALHAKALLVDNDKVFIGSANLDPRSLRLNTEMGLLVSSEELNQQVRKAFERDFKDENAWSVEQDPNGRLLWRSGDTVLSVQPNSSFMQRIEDWFFSILPIEDEL